MKNLCKFLPIVFVVVLCLLICGCSSTPDEKTMIENVSEIDKITDKGTNDWEIIGVEKISEEQDGKSYTVNVNITMENDQYETAERKADLKYINYDKDGWKLDGYENITKVTNAKPKCGIPEERAKKDLKAYAEKSKDYYIYDNYTVEIESHNTAEDYSSDIIKFKITAPGEFWNTTRTVDLSYKPNADGLWEVSGGKVGEKTKSLNTNEICKYYYIGELGIFYKIDSIDFNKGKAVVSVYGVSENGELNKDINAEGGIKKDVNIETRQISSKAETHYLSKEELSGFDEMYEGCYNIAVPLMSGKDELENRLYTNILHIEKDGMYESMGIGKNFGKKEALTELPK